MTKPGQELLDTPVEWGRQLICTNDHDPLYVGLVNWDAKGSRKRRFLLAYWCCYSVGASHYLSEKVGSRFWDGLGRAAENVALSPLGERWPRAHERRHWRGQKCVDSVEWLRREFGYPEAAIISLEGETTLEGVEQRMKRWPQFGPWIAFKAADMLERVLGVPIRFPSTLISLYKDPREGAEMAAAHLNAIGSLGKQTWNAENVVDQMLMAYNHIPAPGVPGRWCNIQEVETVLCKWKSARRGRYRLGLDTADHRIELEEWGAHDLLAAYPRLPA